MCFAKATRYVGGAPDQQQQGRGRKKADKRKKPKGATQVYGVGVRGDARTHARHMQLAARAGPAEDALPGNDFYGVHEGTLFLTQVVPHLDIIEDVVIDWMHNICEGKLVTDIVYPVCHTSDVIMFCIRFRGREEGIHRNLQGNSHV